MDADEELGGQQYRYIAEKSVEDLGLGGSIESIEIKIKVGEPVFIIRIKYKELSGKSTLGEASYIDSRKNGIRVTLSSEIFLGDALKALWSKYGRDRVEQIGRLEIFVSGADPDEVKGIRLSEKGYDLESRINELATRIIPEGFRVRSATRGKGTLTIIASEDPIKEEWKALAAQMGGGSGA
ncbi:MAG: methanogenesis marker 17 protein [Candidatus Verstraetearchaeota archaeon]|nr:methanogenesis marker 17 protein [Candidatus Verstraetearchaeota archaeon]